VCQPHGRGCKTVALGKEKGKRRNGYGAGHLGYQGNVSRTDKVSLGCFKGQIGSKEANTAANRGKGWGCEPSGDRGSIGSSKRTGAKGEVAHP